MRRRSKSRREARKDERRQRKYDQDKLCAEMKPGDWVRFRSRDSGAWYPDHEGKLARIKDWDDDDGFNKRRAPRNKKVFVEVEPHLSENPKVMFTTLKDFVPLTEMEVIAVAAL